MSAEPCVYERLWESIAVLRESGQRYGMSERDIERFITQVLETNEPQEEQPAFPLLRATAKCALALCLLLVLALGLSQPQSASEPLSLGLNWSCPLGAARLLDLPIAHKYNLQGTALLYHLHLLCVICSSSALSAPPLHHLLLLCVHLPGGALLQWKRGWPWIFESTNGPPEQLSCRVCQTWACQKHLQSFQIFFLFFVLDAETH
uniref:Uncharacterized protein n=1 Tax=Periophthalmus magnuspinnatus TaxID=409849 RepID=A0A3B4BAE0_9GOBI